MSKYQRIRFYFFNVLFLVNFISDHIFIILAKLFNSLRTKRLEGKDQTK